MKRTHYLSEPLGDGAIGSAIKLRLNYDGGRLLAAAKVDYNGEPVTIAVKRKGLPEEFTGAFMINGGSEALIKSYSVYKYN